MSITVAPAFNRSYIPNSFIVYFEFWYRIGICPFKLIICKRTGTCKTIRSKMSLVRTVVFWVLLLAGTSMWLWRTMFIKQMKQMKLKYFDVAFVIGLNISLITYLLTISFNSAAIATLVDINLSMPATNQYRERKDRWTPIRLIWLNIVTNQLIFTFRRLQIREWSFQKYFNFLQRLGKRSTPWVPTNTAISDDTNKILLVILGLLAFTSLLLAKSGIESLLIISAKGLITNLRSLERRVGSMSAEDGFKEYFKLKLLLEKNGKAVGLANSGIVFGYLPMIVSMIPKLIQPTFLGTFLESGFDSSIPILFLGFASWYTNKVNNIFLKLFTNEKQISRLGEPRLSIIFLELGNGGLTYNGVGWIKFTPDLLSKIISLILTFAVVIIQLKAES